MGCSFFGPDEKGLIEAAKEHRKYANAEYEFTAKITPVQENDYTNITYSHIGWVKVTHIRTGKSWKMQFGYTKTSHKWEPTLSQLQEEMKELEKFQRLLKH